MKIIAFPGWGFSQKIFNRILPGLPEASETLPWYIFDRENNTAAAEKIGESKNVILLGCSLGGFFAGTLLGLPQVKGAVLMGCGYSFFRSRRNPFGADRKTLGDMRERLERQPQKTLSGFLQLCCKSREPNTWGNTIPENNLTPGFLVGNGYTDMDNTQLLLRGLDFLKSVRLPHDTPRDKPVLIVQGRCDRIFNFKGAEKTASDMGWGFSPVKDGGHLLPLSHPHIIQAGLELVKTHL